MHKRIASWGLLFTSLLALAPVAYADATVVVELKRPDGSSADGIVKLVQKDSVFSCHTENGRCSIRGVPGGSYTVNVEQAGKTPPKAKTVVIPPSGEVKLIVAAS